MDDLLPRLFPVDGLDGSNAALLIDALKERVQQAQQLVSSIDGTLHDTTRASDEVAANAKEWLQRLTTHGAEGLTLQEVAARAEELTNLIAGVSTSLEFFADMGGAVPGASDQTDSGMRKAFAVLRICNEAPKDLLEYRDAAFGRASTKELAAKAHGEHLRLRSLGAELSQIFHLEPEPDSEEIAKAIAVLCEGNAWYRSFQRRWRRARKLYKRLSKDPSKQPASLCLERLTALHQYLRDDKNYQDGVEFGKALGVKAQ